MVDLPGMGRSRTSSFDSKRSSVSDVLGRGPYAGRCPTAREYDSMGYLAPRSKQIPQYLQLLNHAPELDLPAFKSAEKMAEKGIVGSDNSSGSAFRPVGPYTHAAFGALGLPESGVGVVYTPVTCCVNTAASSSVGSECSSLDQRPRRRSSSSSSQPAYGVVSVQDPKCGGGGGEVAERLVVDLTDLNRIKAAQRKYSDQDLYSSTAPYNQNRGGRRRSSNSSSISEHPYTRVATDPILLSNNNNNNIHGSSSSYGCYSSNNSAHATPVPLPRDRLNSNQDPLNLSYSSSRGGVDPLNQSYCSSRGGFDALHQSYCSTRGQDPLNQSYNSARSRPPQLNWVNRSASDSDSVFEHEDETRDILPPYINMPNGARSRSQMFTEGPLAGFDIAQASLV